MIKLRRVQASWAYTKSVGSDMYVNISRNIYKVKTRCYNVQNQEYIMFNQCSFKKTPVSNLRPSRYLHDALTN